MNWELGDSVDDVEGWLSERIPDDWFDEPPKVVIDREEIVLIGTLPAPEAAEADSEVERATQVDRAIRGFREQTRERRMEIASELEHRSGKKVAWGVRCDDELRMFTTLSVPVMTRLRQPERQVLDTLVAGGVARSRSEALAWCVKLTGQHTGEWLEELRLAMARVDEVRQAGPPT